MDSGLRARHGRAQVKSKPAGRLNGVEILMFGLIAMAPVAMEIARQQAEREGLAIDFAVMDAEHTTFPDASFDLIVGSGILHHLDLDRTYTEIARLLAPGGRAVFVEPLGHNALIN